MQKRIKLHQHVDVSTAAQCRIPIFQPTRRPRYIKGVEVSTGYGQAVIDGKIGQQHRDFIECCRLTALEQGLDAVNRYCCIVDPNRVRTAMSAGRTRICWLQLKDIAEDLRRCEVREVEIYSRPGWGVVTAGILDSVTFKGVGVVEGKTGHGCQVGERELWKVPFSEAWTRLIGVDLPVSYRGQLLSIVKLRHGVSQAVARLMLSHAPGATYSINEALAFVGAASISTRRHRRGELLADADALAEMGILIAGEMLVAEA